MLRSSVAKLPGVAVTGNIANGDRSAALVVGLAGDVTRFPVPLAALGPGKVRADSPQPAFS
jgi:hypothetical protein